MTGSDIFNSAMDLCALRSLQGNTPNDCLDLRQRAVSLINILMAENAFLDSLIKKKSMAVSNINELNENIEMSDVICASVLPYGLAFLLILEEDPQSAAVFQKKYEGQLIRIRASLKGNLEEIKEAY